MAIDDDAQIDPATLPENVELMNAIDAAIGDSRPEKMKAPAVGDMESLVGRR